nr:potassium/proton antiporter [Maliibacterium massiliense]
MLLWMLVAAVALLLCVASSKLLYRWGIPTLLIFMVLGMLFGTDGVLGIAFENADLAQKICSFGLVFIMFYGGFGTSWKAARPVVKPAIWMATLGVVLTALLTGLFAMLVLRCTPLEGLLIGSVVGSTDAASVFAILRARKLNIKGGLASLLEVESGSNDPIAYMLTMIVVTLMRGAGTGMLAVSIVLQIALGLGIGWGLAASVIAVLRRVHLEIEGLYPILITALVLLGYAGCALLGGNGYLCVYVMGIMIGNSRFAHKRSLVHFFDGVSWLMQMLLFFTLGLLSFPSQLPGVLIPGVLVSLFMIFIARPCATFAMLAPFRMPWRAKALVSWVGMRGAASIVFALFAVTQQVAVKNDLFHTVFFVALFSVAVQGTLLPAVARRLDMVDAEATVMKTFNDYQEELPVRLIEVEADKASPYVGKTLKQVQMPPGVLVVMIKRKNARIVPRGNTRIMLGDVLVISGEDLDQIAT